MTIDALAPFRWLRSPYGDRGDVLGEIYCVTLLRGLDPAEVLRRFGARASTQMSFDELDLAVCDFTMATGGGEGGGWVGVIAAGDGCAAVEPMGWSGTDEPTPTGSPTSCASSACLWRRAPRRNGTSGTRTFPSTALSGCSRWGPASPA
ncbi:DUF6461 domain-containing protein [Nonomuraea wenchangensis]|uniref:DUF6461 domain-containing protein n=1 Tax=Nonomuraea wenchangensis TaxID=568860 RepID=UPI0034300F82